MLRTLSIALLVCLVTGCATVTRGDKQDVKFVSDPSGATVTLNGGKPHTTPFSAILKRKETQHVLASYPGYQPLKFDLIAIRDLAAVPQFAVPGGSALVATDVATGADRNYPDTVHIKFREKAGVSSEPLLMKEFHGQVLTPDEYEKAFKDYQQALYNNRPVNSKHPEQRRQ